jgi:hypothetical protein
MDRADDGVDSSELRVRRLHRKQSSRDDTVINHLNHVTGRDPANSDCSDHVPDLINPTYQCQSLIHLVIMRQQ